MSRDKFPFENRIDNELFIFRLMEAKDHSAILALANRMSEADLWFMRRDITQPQAVNEWIRDIESNRAITVLIEDESHQVIAYGTLYHNQFYWNRHLGEIRIMVSSTYRNRGLGRKIARELTLFAKELNLMKVLAYMAVEDVGARRLFEDLNFQPEAMLTDWVKTRDERTHDLLIMSTSLDGIQS